MTRLHQGFGPRAAGLALLLLAMSQALQAGPYTQLVLPDYLTLTETVEGPTAPELQAAAELKAVHSCVGRLLFSDKLLIVDKLLDNYLARNYKAYISEAHAGKRVNLHKKVRQDWRVVVRYTRLREDMIHKRFLFEPRYPPYFLVLFQRRDRIAVATGLCGKGSKARSIET